MDITPQDDQKQPISDDQELAKALAGVLPDVPEPVVTETAPNPVLAPDPAAYTPPADQPADLSQPTFSLPVPGATSQPAANPVSSELESIKKSALGELRPLIDKVDLPAEEKFDTYLMLIRSTDDSALISPAHAVAQTITDETRRAQALLDIIKEIDYLSRNNQTPNA